MLETKTNTISASSTDQASKKTPETAQALRRGLWKTWGGSLLLFCSVSVYVELCLIKQHQGEQTATSLFNYGEHFVFNYFELRGAAAKLTEGWTLEQIRDYTIENGCDPTDEEYRESAQALQAFRSQQAHTFSGKMCL